jgi:predicted TIM-barrel fold metal-dependent hydrolase
MIDDAFVIDAVAHAPNFTNDNCVNRSAHELIALVKQLHLQWNPPGYRLDEDQFLVDVDVETVARTLFLESATDMTVHHHLPLYSWFHDGNVSQEKNVELARRYPQRVISYAGVDPTTGPEACIESLERQMEDLPSIVGLKFYPHQVEPWRTFRLDEEDRLFPLYARALELGIRTIAVHKASPLGPVPMNPYRVDDVEGAAYAFPQLNFEVIHSGLAFVDETAQAVARFPNVYANLETTMQLTYFGPGKFQEILAQLLFWGGKEKLLYSASVPYGHPRPQIEALWNLQLSEDLLEKYNIEQLTLDDKRAILGGNYASMVGLDIEQAKAAIADDEFSQELKARDGELQAPWSNWRDGYAAGRFPRYVTPGDVAVAGSGAVTAP